MSSSDSVVGWAILTVVFFVLLSCSQEGAADGPAHVFQQRIFDPAGCRNAALRRFFVNCGLVSTFQISGSKRIQTEHGE